MSARSREQEHARMAWRHERAIVRYLQRRVHRPEDIADLVQDVYERVLRLDESAEIREPLALLHQIANWALGDFRRRAKRHERITVDSETADRCLEDLGDRTADELADHIDLEQRVQRALAVLPRTHAVVLLLHKQDGFSHEEVATMLQISVHTVPKYIAEAKARIRAMTWER